MLVRVWKGVTLAPKFELKWMSCYNFFYDLLVMLTEDRIPRLSLNSVLRKALSIFLFELAFVNGAKAPQYCNLEQAKQEF